MTPTSRLFLACGAFSGWMVCLLVGWVAGGAVHLLLVLALAAFPWRTSPGETKAVAADGEDQGSSSSQSADGV